MYLVLVRHGATSWSATGQHTGRTDLHLSEQGVEEVEGSRTLFSTMLQAGPDVPAMLITSPLTRAISTAELLTGAASAVLTDANLLEMDYGDFEGLTPEEIRTAHPEWNLWTHGCPNGESIADVGRRADAFLESLDGELVVVFSHGHFLRVLTARFLGLPAIEGRLFTLDTASVSIIADVRGARVVKHWNARPW